MVKNIDTLFTYVQDHGTQAGHCAGQHQAARVELTSATCSVYLSIGG